jgi:predicted RNase H-like HicB family nuclease
VTLPDITHYTYRVTSSAEDAEFVGTCLEFSSLSWLAMTQDEALHGIRDVVRDVVQDLHTSGEPIPERSRRAATPASSTCASANASTASWPWKPRRST